jgi:hypothetical protein
MSIPKKGGSIIRIEDESTLKVLIESVSVATTESISFFCTARSLSKSTHITTKVIKLMSNNRLILRPFSLKISYND